MCSDSFVERTRTFGFYCRTIAELYTVVADEVLHASHTYEYLYFGKATGLRTCRRCWHFSRRSCTTTLYIVYECKILLRNIRVQVRRWYTPGTHLLKKNPVSALSAKNTAVSSIELNRTSGTTRSAAVRQRKTYSMIHIIPYTTAVQYISYVHTSTTYGTCRV